jgi:hypothetical protein
MATRRRGVKHRRRHHAKTKKKLSKRYRGKKGYSKRITIRHARRSDNTDIINTQGGGALASYSEAKTAAGKVYEQLIVMRYLLKRAFESRFDLQHDPVKAFELLQGYTNLSPNEQHDLPQALATLYNKYVSQINPDGREDEAIVTGDNVEVSNEDENFFESMDDLFSGKLPQANFSIKAKKVNRVQALGIMNENLNLLYGEHIDAGDAQRIFTELFIDRDNYYLIVIYYVECPFELPIIVQSQLPKKGRLLFSVQLQQINIRDKIDVIKGHLTYGEIATILSDILKINSNIRKPNSREICEPIKVKINELLESKSSLLRVHPRYHTKCSSNRLQCSITISEKLLKGASIVNEPSSPTALASRTPVVKGKKKDEKTHQVERRIHSTPELHGLTFLGVEAKSPEDLGKIILCRFKNNTQALHRIYHDVVKQSEDIQKLVNSVVSDEHCTAIVREFESKSPKSSTQTGLVFGDFIPKRPAPSRLFPKKQGTPSAKGASARSSNPNPNPNPMPEPGARARSRSRASSRAENETSERARTPKSSGRKTIDELKEEKRRQREIENRQREIENRQREIENQKRYERLSNRQGQSSAASFAPSFPASFAPSFPASFAPSSAASFAPSSTAYQLPG